MGTQQVDPSRWQNNNPFLNAATTPKVVQSKTPLASNNPFLHAIQTADDDDVPLQKLLNRAKGSSSNASEPSEPSESTKTDTVNPIEPLSVPPESLPPPYNEEELRVLVSSGGASAPTIEISKVIDDIDRRKDPLNPPPPQFTTPARVTGVGSPEWFPPTVLYSKSGSKTTLDLPPVFLLALTSHGIEPKDWRRFLEDLMHVHSGHGEDKGVKRLLSLPRKNSVSSVTAEKLCAAWNKQFFIPRRTYIQLEVRGVPRPRLLIFSI
uniref:ARAD1C23518p n=1 Tax=Blastobotrys adeninivorans TaxID=409370 RepID=A0A060T6V8_BLAAD